MAIYMKVDGIDGDVTAKGFEKMIEVYSFNFGVGRGISTKAGNSQDREATAPSFSEINITKALDKTSPLFFTEACVGKAKNYEFHFVETSDALEEYFDCKLSNVMISSYSTSSDGGDPTESISLSYDKIELSFTPRDDKDKAGGAVRAAYNLATASTK
ncbi:MAG: type VI secretion system tube protein Hcp [Alphaproteobacteria bacterium]|nr:type VI secretion system tube protein Hcp [Alphaproteobacteria bacterium]